MPVPGTARGLAGARIVATIHPSAILRAPDPDARRSERRRFIADLEIARDLVARSNAPQP